MADAPRVAPPLDLEAIKAREAAATKGPWWEDFDWRGDRMNYGVEASEPPMHKHFVVHSPRWLHGSSVMSQEQLANIRFIAHARQDIPALVAEVEHVRELNRVLAHQLERRADGMDPLTQDLRARAEAAEAEVERLRAVASAAERPQEPEGKP